MGPDTPTSADSFMSVNHLIFVYLKKSPMLNEQENIQFIITQLMFQILYLNEVLSRLRDYKLYH